MSIFKIAATTIAAATIATASFAGNPEPVADLEPIVEEVAAGTSAGSGGIILPLIALIAVAALIADDGT